MNPEVVGELVNAVYCPRDCLFTRDFCFLILSDLMQFIVILMGYEWDVPSGKLYNSLLVKITIVSGSSHTNWYLFPIVMLNYQRVAMGNIFGSIPMEIYVEVNNP